MGGMSRASWLERTLVMTAVFALLGWIVTDNRTAGLIARGTCAAAACYIAFFAGRMKKKEQ